MTELSEFVAEGRCPCCGQEPPIWTPEAIVESIQRWADEHNGVAPTEWQPAPRGCPSQMTVRRIFGSWTNAILAAGLTPTKRGRWDQEACIEALQRWARDHDGQPPRVIDWRRAGRDRPTADRVMQVFGGWNKALEAAGFWTRGASGARFTDHTKRKRAPIKRRPSFAQGVS